MELLFLTSMPVIKDLETTQMEFFQDAPLKQSTMLSWLLAMELKMELTIGWWRTPGDLTGETKEWSKSDVETMSVVLEDTATQPIVVRPQEPCLIHQWHHHPNQSHHLKSVISIQDGLV